MNSTQWEQYVRATRILNERLAAKAAGRFAYGLRTPGTVAQSEMLAVYACGVGKDLVMVPVDDERIAGNRAISKIQACYKE